MVLRLACLILCLFLTCGLFASEKHALPSFDFTNNAEATGWSRAHDLEPFEKSADGLRLKITGGDPYMLGPPMDLSAEEGLFLRIRLKSDTGGLAEVFFFEKHPGDGKTSFEAPAGVWTEAILPLPPLGPNWRFRFDPPGGQDTCVLALLRVERAAERGVLKVVADAGNLTLTARSGPAPLDIVELPPHLELHAIASASAVASLAANEEKSITIPRHVHDSDRIYSGFVAREPSAGRPASAGVIHYAEEINNISKNSEPWIWAPSKKGLQVQMVEDALALGAKHAALNVSFANILDWENKADSYVWKVDDKTIKFGRKAIDSLTGSVKRLSTAGVQVTLIILNYVTKNPDGYRIVIPSRTPKEIPNDIAAFNVDSEDGVRYYTACLEFLADRFSGQNKENGRAVGYIIGNEVNSHWEWYNLGRVTMPVLADEYMRAVRIAHTAVRKSSASARVYISLEHCWARSNGGDPLKYCPGRAFLDELNRLSKLEGDFDWHVAYHPYPENLFEPRSWLDKNATASPETRYITFKNLEQLPLYLSRPEQLYHGQTRRVILSEQGFNSPDKPDGEEMQAAGYCYAWQKVAALDGIDAFILHRHVDHEKEGGLNLGLWTHKTDSLAAPDRKKRIYEVFRLADTPEWKNAFEFALPIIGIKHWEELTQPSAH